MVQLCELIWIETASKGMVFLSEGVAFWYSQLQDTLLSFSPSAVFAVAPLVSTVILVFYQQHIFLCPLELENRYLSRPS